MNCGDALPLNKLAQEQRLAMARVMKALEVRGEDVCINPNLVRRREDELAEERTSMQKRGRACRR